MLEGKGNYKNPGILAVNTIKQRSNKRAPQKNKKTFQKQALQQTSHQRNKHLGSPPCEILRTFLKINKEGSQAN